MPKGNTTGLRLSVLAPLVALSVLLLANKCDPDPEPAVTGTVDQRCVIEAIVPPGVHYIKVPLNLTAGLDLSGVAVELVYPGVGNFTTTVTDGVGNTDFSVRFESTAPTVTWVHVLAKPENGPARGLLNTGPGDLTLTMRLEDIPACAVSVSAGGSSFDKDRQLITDPAQQATLVVVGCP